MACTPGGIKAVPPAAAHRLSILAVNVHFPRAPSCFMCRPYGRPLIHIMYNRDPGSVPLPRNRRLGVGGVGLPVVVQSCWGWTLAAMSVVFMRAPCLALIWYQPLKLVLFPPAFEREVSVVLPSQKAYRYNHHGHERKRKKHIKKSLIFNHWWQGLVFGTNMMSV